MILVSFNNNITAKKHANLFKKNYIKKYFTV
jgi:hypothetical protein